MTCPECGRKKEQVNWKVCLVVGVCWLIAGIIATVLGWYFAAALTILFAAFNLFLADMRRIDERKQHEARG